MYNLGLKKESWPPDPARFVTMHEWAAYPLTDSDAYFGTWVTQWHGAVTPGKVYHLPKGGNFPLESPEKFVAPVLFVDGHSQRFDFTTVLKREPIHTLDPTTDWMWYKPLP